MSATQRGGVLGLAALVVCVASCGASDRPESAGDGKPNIIVFVTDTLRADALEAYGNSTVESPALSALAARGVVYEWTRTLARALSELQARNRARSAARSSQVPSRRPELLPADERAALEALGYLDAEPPGVGE